MYISYNNYCFKEKRRVMQEARLKETNKIINIKSAEIDGLLDDEFICHCCGVPVKVCGRDTDVSIHFRRAFKNQPHSEICTAGSEKTDYYQYSDIKLTDPVDMLNNLIENSKNKPQEFSMGREKINDEFIKPTKKIHRVNKPKTLLKYFISHSLDTPYLNSIINDYVVDSRNVRNKEITKLGVKMYIGTTICYHSDRLAISLAVPSYENKIVYAWAVFQDKEIFWNVRNKIYEYKKQKMFKKKIAILGEWQDYKSGKTYCKIIDKRQIMWDF